MQLVIFLLTQYEFNYEFLLLHILIYTILALS